MPVRKLNREQAWLLPPSLEELIPDDHPARFVASVVDNLGPSVWEKLSIDLEGEALGAPAYHPRALLSVWLYGFMSGTRSSRKLEAACRDQMPYLWLTGWQHPDHNTLWRFYKAHRGDMRQLFKLSVRTALKMGLVDMAVQAVDGTKIGANASKERTYDRKGLEALLGRLEKTIGELERENEAGNDQAPVHLPEKLRRAESLRAEVKAAIEQLSESKGDKRVNLTDSDANLMKGRHGMIAGYNMQAVASPLKAKEAGKAGILITAIDAVKEPDDHFELISMMRQAAENTGMRAAMTLADGGYHSGANLAVCEEREQVVVMPESQARELQKPYHKDKFAYGSRSDTYVCPCGQTLEFVKTKMVRNTRMRVYRGTAAKCRPCMAFGECTRDKHHGRELQIGEYEAALRRHREFMSTEAARLAFKGRKELIEAPFGIIKEPMGVRRFLLRGLAQVRAEANVIATAFNLRTLYSIWCSWTQDKRLRLVGA